MSTTEPLAPWTSTGPGGEDATRGRLAGLSPEKRALLERLVLERRGASVAGSDAPIPLRDGPGPWPLSYAQELMWLLDQLAPGSNAYNSPAATRLEGPLDVAALRRALDAVVARNEVLRTTYDAVDGRPVQVVHPPHPVDLAVVDLSGLPAESGQAELAQRLQSESERPYDLRTDRILRPMLFRLGAEDHVLLLVLHHIAIDGWSKGVLWRELTACYDAYAEGRDPDLPPLPVQYADWAGWHRSWLDSGVLDEQLAFWRNHLRDAPALLELPTDRPRPQVRSGRGDRRDTMLGVETLDRLRRLAREERATLFMVVLAAFGVLLARYSGQDRVVVGTPIAGRNRVEIEDVVGYFMNTLALHVDLRGDPTFRSLLARVREGTIGAYAHQDVPFERVVAERNPERDLSRTPLFQAMLVLQNQKRNDFDPVGLVATPVRHERGWAKFDLTVGMGERPTGLNTSWEFSTDLFEPATIERMMRHFGVLLDAVVTDPDRPVSTLALLSAEENRQIAGWESGGPTASADGCLHDLFARQAVASPEAPAVAAGPTTLTYAELRAAAGRLARHLRGAGVGARTPVGVCVGRSAELVVALLAVLQAGGTCVPLDPAYPPERLRLLLQDTAAPVMLVAGEQPPGDTGSARVIRIDAFVEVDAGGGELDPLAGPGDPAYVLYTSGSTGRPKGVVLGHAGLANHAVAAGCHYRLGPADRVLQFSSPSFDISVEEIFASLAAGACVVVPPADLPLGGPELADWLQRERITVLDLPTAFWHEWVGDLAHRGLALPSTLRLVVVGGERASPGVYATWRRLAGDRVAWRNTYGPTEASVVATAFEPSADWRPVEGAELPIGRPLPGVTVRVLDRHQRPVPVGVRGELYVGGVGVAHCYLDAPELTAERFGHDPDDPAGRLYRTGDLASWRPDGTLVYAGRIDRQVKHRGFRVEPGEVEAALVATGEVDESVVMLRGQPGQERLVAYAVTRDGTDPDRGRELRQRLAQSLPAYLVPAAVVPVSALPRTSNGKVDHDRLPDPVAVPVRGVDGPGDDVERRLAGIWRSVLGIDSVGVSESFFDVGGHSLLAVRTLAEVERSFGTRLPLATLIIAPTIAEQAAILRRERPAPTWDSLVPLRPGGTRTPLFLVHDIRGQALMYRELVHRLGPDQPVYALQGVGLDRREQPLAAIPAMAAHYLAEIRTVQPQGPYLLAGFCFGGVIAVEMAHQLEESGERVALVALFHARPYGETAGAPERFLDRARRRMGEFAAIDPSGRLPMIPETAERIYIRHSRRHRARAVRYFLDRGRPLPRLLRDIELVNRMSVVGYRTPACRAPVLVFLGDNGRRDDVERRRQMWARVTGDLDVRFIGSSGTSTATMLLSPHVDELARQLRAALDAALPGPL